MSTSSCISTAKPSDDGIGQTPIAENNASRYRVMEATGDCNLSPTHKRNDSFNTCSLRKHMEDIQRLMDREVPVIEDHPWHNGMEDIPLHRGRGTRSNNGGGDQRSGDGKRSFKKKPRNKRPFNKGGGPGGPGGRSGEGQKQGQGNGRGKRPSRKKGGNNFGGQKFKPGND